MTEGGSSTTPFDNFYRVYHDRVRRLAACRFGDSTADDVTQEVMMRAHKHFGELMGSSNAWPWLAVVTRNVGINEARAARRSVPMELAELDELAPPEADAPAVAAVAGDMRWRLGQALARLTERDRAALQLREIDRVPIVEIAAREGTTAGAMRQRLLRARELLRREFRALGGERLMPAALPRLTSLPPTLHDGISATISVIVALFLAGPGSPARGPDVPPNQPTAIELPASPQEPNMARSILQMPASATALLPRHTVGGLIDHEQFPKPLDTDILVDMDLPLVGRVTIGLGQSHGLSARTRALQPYDTKVDRPALSGDFPFAPPP